MPRIDQIDDDANLNGTIVCRILEQGHESIKWDRNGGLY